MSSLLYGFKFFHRIRLNYYAMGFGEIRFLKCCDVHKFLVLANNTVILFLKKAYSKYI